MTDQEKFEAKWDVQLRKGTLELVIMASLKGRDLYGLQLLNFLHEFETITITEGTLYPLLDRLKREGVIDADWRQEDGARPRKYYRLTTLGEEVLPKLTNRWRKSAADIESILDQRYPGAANENSK